MNVVRLAEYANRDLIELAQWMLNHAVDIEGVGVTFRMRDGTQQTSFTGYYQRHPEEASGVAMRLAMKLAKAAAEG